MNCCVNCFKDVEIIDIIKNRKTKGNCYFCKSKNIYIYNLQDETTLSDMFGEMLEIYTVASSLPDAFPKENLDLLKNIFHTQWPIFNVEPDCIYRLLTSICSEKYEEQPDLFNLPVGIKESQDKDYLDEFSLLRNYQWCDFVSDIKHANRFHTDHINKKVFDKFAHIATKTYKSGKTFYRARISEDDKCIRKSEMGAPPAKDAKSGRVNPNGIRVLYLSDSIKTTLYEIRAGLLDFVTVGSFKLRNDIKIFNFISLSQASPFITNINQKISYTQQAINFEHLKLISREIARPLRRQDSVLDYLPTQYICDYIKGLGYDGVEYFSSVYEKGVNVALFDADKYKCSASTLYQIKSILYTEEQML